MVPLSSPETSGRVERLLREDPGQDGLEMDFQGAWHRVGSLFEREMPENVLVAKVSPKRLAAFWADAEQLGSWNLMDRADLATDLTSYEVFLRHGRRSLRLSCYGFIEDSPQRWLVRMIERLGGIDALFRKAERQRSEP
jgi:hypothetical protein